MPTYGANEIRTFFLKILNIKLHSSKYIIQAPVHIFNQRLMNPHLLYRTFHFWRHVKGGMDVPTI